MDRGTWPALVHGVAKSQTQLKRLSSSSSQYSCLGNLLDRGAWQDTIHGVTKSWTRLSDFTFTFHFPALEKEMATHSSVLAWRIPGRGSLVGCCLWGCKELDTTEQLHLVAQMEKNLPAMQETWVQSLGQDDPLEKGMATYSSILARRISWTEKPGGLQSEWSQRVGHY